MSVWYDKVAQRWRIRIRRRGKEIARYLPPGVTKQQAEEAHVAAMRQFFDRVELNKRPRYTLAEALTKYLEEHNVHNKHPKNAISNVRVLLPLISGRSLDAAHDVCAAIVARAEWKPATRNRRLALIRRVVNLAYRKWGWLDKPIVIDLLPERNERQVRLTKRQVQLLANKAGSYLPVARHWIILAAYTGMRRSEIQGLHRGSLVRGALHLRDTKNQRARAVPLNPVARKALEGWLRAEPRPNPRWLYRQFERARDDLRLGDVRFHDLRHFFASELINTGADTYTVGRILGHLSAASTRRYAHLDVERLAEAVRRVK